MARSIQTSVFLIAVLLLGCTSSGELTEVAKRTPDIGGPSPVEENASGVPLTQTPMSASSTSAVDCPNPQPDSDVHVASDKLTYDRGETILVTICNYRPDVIFAPPPGGCSVVTVQRLENTGWVTEGSCPAQEVHVLSIPARNQLRRALAPSAPGIGSQEPITSEPIPPYVFQDNLQNLPTSTPSRFPAIEVPEGAIAPPFSLLKDDLLPGTYRIEFSFTVGHPLGSIQTTYSVNFVVIG